MASLKAPVKLAIAGAIVVAILGGVAAYFLLPSEESAQELKQTAEAFSQSVNVNAAADAEKLKAQYESELSAGAVTLATAQAYAYSLKTSGDVAGAVAIWREYTAKNPTDLQGYKELASFENAAGNEDEYLKVLEKIAELEPSEENLKSLSGYQNFKKQYAAQLVTLQRLVEMTKEQNAEYLLAMADVALVVENKEAALTAYSAYFKNDSFASKLDYSKVEPYVRLLAQAGKKDEAVAEAVKVTRAVEPVATPEVAVPAAPVAEVPPAPPMPESDVKVVMEPQSAILESVMTLAQATIGDMPPPPPPPPAQLLMMVAPDESASAAPADPSSEPVDETPLATNAEAVIPPPPAPAAPTEDSASIIPPAPAAVMVPPAPATDMAGDAPPPPPPLVNEEVPAPIAPMAEAVTSPTDTVPPVETPQVNVGSETIAPNPVTDVSATPTATPVAPPAPAVVLDDALRARIADVLLFEAGADYAVKYIEGVSSEGQISQPMEAIYARALVGQGKYEKALPVLKTLSVQGGDYREWYFLALSNAAKKDMQVRKDLVAHVKESFQAGDLTEQQKLDRVYALLNAGEKSLALDYTERSLQAATDAEAKDKWQKLHRALTVKPQATSGKKVATRQVPRVTLAQKLELASKPNASQDYMRRTAFEALAAGRKMEAMNLFSRLASMNGANSSDAQQLSYLWGARITGQELSWVIDRANENQGAAQAGWIEMVANGAAAEDVVAVGNAYPAWMQNPTFERRYANSLVQLGDRGKLGEYLSWQANASQSVEAYQMMASQAGSMMDVASQEQALRRAAEIAPNNRDIWLQLTSMYMSRARYTAAEQTLSNAMRVDGSQYATDQYSAAKQALAMNYYAGMLQKRDGEYTQANQYFAQGMQASNGQMFDDRDAQVKMLATQMALGDESNASQGFEVLLESNPGDASLLADYMGALLDRGSYLQALDVASRHGADVVLDNPLAVEDSSPILVRAPNGEMPLIQSMSGGSELKLQYSRPLPAGYQVLNQVANPSWVSYTTTSYDTALISAKSGYTLQANATQEGLLISAIPTPDTSSAEAIRQRYLRLQLLYARLELETGSTDKALERMESLAPTYQEYPEYRAYQANAEYYAGNLKRGLNLIKRAQVGDPKNEDIAYLRRNIERFHAEHVKLDHEWQKLGDTKMHITTAEVRKQFDNSIEVFAQYQSNFIDTDVVRRASGALQSVDGNRWRATVSLAKFMDDSSIIEGSLYANKDTPGAGLSYQFVNPIGTTQIYAQYHKPYWDVTEAVVEDATRDRAAAWHLWRPDPRWSVKLDAGYNRYNIDKQKGLADSVGVQATVLHTIFDKQPYVALAYGYDGEYLLGGVKRDNYLGSEYKLLPLRSREVHSLSTIIYHDFTRDTNGELNVGYAVDRLGGHGPSAEGRLTHFITDDVDVQLRARYGLETNNTDNDALSVGGYVRWTW